MAPGAVELVSTYVNTIGTNEPDYGRLLRTIDCEHPFYPSMMIGHGCFMLATSSSPSTERRAGNCFIRAHDVIENRLRLAGSPIDEGPLSALQHTARMLICRDDPTALSYLQDDLNVRTIDTIHWLQSEMSDTKQNGGRRINAGHLLGTLAQQVTIAAYTRNKDACVLPAMALTHHDRGPSRPQNYDALVISKPAAGDTTMRPRITKIQIKAGCLGLDPLHKNRAISEHNRDVQSLSATDVALVSGCCDLNLRESVKAILIEDEEGTPKLTSKQRRNLNALSDHMAGVANGTDTWDRYGRAKKKRITLTPGYLRLIRELDLQEKADDGLVVV